MYCNINNISLIISGVAAQKVYKCKHCSYSTSIVWNIKVHVRTHTQERPFTCHVCPKTFNHKISLDTHLCQHTGRKPFKCNICFQEFAFSSSQRRHILTHLKSENASYPVWVLISSWKSWFLKSWKSLWKLKIVLKLELLSKALITLADNKIFLQLFGGVMWLIGYLSFLPLLL